MRTHVCLQLTFLAQIYDWLEKQQQQPGSDLTGALDLSNVALAGHSRGGKLAALQFANGRVPLSIVLQTQC